MSQVKAVVYDFGGVLLSYESVQQRWREMDELLNLPLGSVLAASTDKEFYKLLGGDHNVFLGMMSIDEIEEEMHLIKYLNSKHNVKNEVLLRPFSDTMRGSVVKYHTPMLETLDKVRNHGLKLGLLTNNMFLDKEGLEHRFGHGLDISKFDVLVESCVDKVIKPHPASYELMERRLGVEPSEILFLDDLEMNTQAAAARNWQTIHVKPGDIDSAVRRLHEITGIPL